jgi:hypothetical protein
MINWNQRLVSGHFMYNVALCNPVHLNSLRGHHGCDRLVVGFTTTCAISAYHH